MTLTLSVKALYVLLGISQLTPWHVYTKSIPLFVQRIDKDYSLATYTASSITSAYTICNGVTMFVAVLTGLDERLGSSRRRIIGGFAANMLVILAAMLFPTGLLMTNTSNWLFATVVLLAALAGFFNALTVKALLVVTTRSVVELTQTFGTGQGLSGLVFSLATTLAVILNGNSIKLGLTASISFFAVGFFIIASTLVLFVYNQRTSAIFQCWLSDHSAVDEFDASFEEDSLDSNQLVEESDNRETGTASSMQTRYTSTLMDVDTSVVSNSPQSLLHSKASTPLMKIEEQQQKKNHELSDFGAIVDMWRRIKWYVLGMALSFAFTVSTIATYVVSNRIPMSTDQHLFFAYFLPAVFIIYDLGEVVGRRLTIIPKDGVQHTLFGSFVRWSPVLRAVVLAPVFVFFAPVLANHKHISMDDPTVQFPLAYTDLVYLIAVFLLGISSGWSLVMLFMHAQVVAVSITQGDLDQSEEYCLSALERKQRQKACGVLWGLLMNIGLVLGALSTYAMPWILSICTIRSLS